METSPEEINPFAKFLKPNLCLHKENWSIGKPLGEDRGLVALMGIRIF